MRKIEVDTTELPSVSAFITKKRKRRQWLVVRWWNALKKRFQRKKKTLKWHVWQPPQPPAPIISDNTMKLWQDSPRARATRKLQNTDPIAIKDLQF